MRMKKNFYINGFAFRLALKQRLLAIRKWFRSGPRLQVRLQLGKIQCSRNPFKTTPLSLLKPQHIFVLSGHFLASKVKYWQILASSREIRNLISRRDMKNWRSEDRQGALSQYCILNGKAELLVGNNTEHGNMKNVNNYRCSTIQCIWCIVHNPQSIDSLWQRASARNVGFTTGLTTFLRW